MTGLTRAIKFRWNTTEKGGNEELLSCLMKKFVWYARYSGEFGLSSQSVLDNSYDILRNQFGFAKQSWNSQQFCRLDELGILAKTEYVFSFLLNFIECPSLEAHRPAAGNLYC
jgi:hypothetical protein